MNKNFVTDLILRARVLTNAGQTSTHMVSAYWDIKQELFDELTLWGYGRTPAEAEQGLTAPAELQEDLRILNDLMNEIWHKIIYAA